MKLASFPLNQLAPSGGNIRFTVYDHSSTTKSERKFCRFIAAVGHEGQSEHLFVDLRLNFAPVEVQGETFLCSMTLSPIPWNSIYRHWWQLVGMNRTVHKGEDGIEGVFYADKPYTAQQIEYSFRYIQENLFEVTISMLLDGEEDSLITVQSKATVPFEGLFIGNGFCADRASHEIEMSVFESTPSTDEQGVEYYKPRWDNLGKWIVRTSITKAPECLSAFQTKKISIEYLGLEPAMDCNAYILHCPCGAEQLDILYRQSPENPELAELVLDPIAARCPNCGRETVLFDSTKDGYNAKIDCASTIQGTSDPIVWECPSCQSPGRIIVVYSHCWGDEEDLPEDIADWFGWFTLLHQCEKTDEFHNVADWECA